ncbi:PLDc N-terminal domain-containing protein [Micrococcus sp. 2A]|uniref:PLDc N-terminal domain-containing protein n=1 Tax=Micrococcus sp. 2A TaxID=3142261 RepID=UPI0026034788|nr:PLDc N-terminal domain-containing protein [uncultured Micrococcus sp.]
MGRFLIPAAIVLVGLTLYALFEALLTPAHQVRSMPKWAWVAVVVLVPLVGPLLWLFLGRARPAGATGRPAARPASPDDDEDFLRTLRTQRRQAERERELDRRDAELRAREEELRRRRETGQEPDGPEA